MFQGVGHNGRPSFSQKSDFYSIQAEDIDRIIHEAQRLAFAVESIESSAVSSCCGCIFSKPPLPSKPLPPRYRIREQEGAEEDGGGEVCRLRAGCRCGQPTAEQVESVLCV